MADSSELGTSELDPITSPNVSQRPASPQRPFGEGEGPGFIIKYTLFIVELLSRKNTITFMFYFSLIYIAFVG